MVIFSPVIYKPDSFWSLPTFIALKESSVNILSNFSFYSMFHKKDSYGFGITSVILVSFIYY